MLQNWWARMSLFAFRGPAGENEFVSSPLRAMP